MEFLSDYGLFLAKAVTIVIAIAIVLGLLASLKQRGSAADGHIEVNKLNEKFDAMRETLQTVLLDKQALKLEQKNRKKQSKAEDKEAKKQAKNGSDAQRKKRVFALDFAGDIKASAVQHLREEISAVLSVAKEADEVVIRLESLGGMVHSYGLAASQLQRIRSQSIPLTVCIDKVAASGGYMMACVADKIIAAPFAIIGSIGVVAQLPNFHRVLKKYDVDYEVLTAGEYKRTLTMLGENTEQGRKKFQQDIEDTHELFKEFVKANREVVDIENVATGEVWFGKRALDRQLLDEIATSDEYLTTVAKDADVYQISFIEKKSLTDKLGLSIQTLINRLSDTLIARFNSTI